MLRALDLYCCAGGASRGLQMAGFHVTGVDCDPQPDYIGDAFVRADALSYPLEGFDLVWASPPCQAFTAYKRRKNHVRPRPNLIPQTRDRLRQWGGQWIMENVEGAPLESPITLCGSMFGLDVRRHRLFETSFPVAQPSCAHHLQTPRFPPATNRTNLRCTVEVGVWRIPLDVQQRAMGINWMPLDKLSQAIPPAYAHWLAEQALAHREAA